MYICICICICICVYMYIYMCVYIYIYIHIHLTHTQTHGTRGARPSLRPHSARAGALALGQRKQATRLDALPRTPCGEV